MLDRRLEHVVAVARAGALSRAADEVGLTQSGLTRSVASLERELGFALFRRTPRGVAITERGQPFIERAARLLEDARDLMAGGVDGVEPERALRIDVAPTSLQRLLAGALASVVTRWPQVRLVLTGGPVEQVVQRLQAGVVDVAVGFEEAFAIWPEIDRAPAGVIETVLYVRRGHALASRESVSREELAEHVFVAPSESRPYAGDIRRLLAGVASGWRSRVHTVDDFTVAARLVAATDAIGFATRAYAGTPDFLRRFACVPAQTPFHVAPLCCAWRAGAEAPGPVRSLISALQSRGAHL